MSFQIEPEWTLPNSGLFEFDFVYLVNRPKNHDHCISPNEMELLIKWFQHKNDVEKTQPYGLALAFSSICEFLTFKSDQLAAFVDLIDGNLNI